MSSPLGLHALNDLNQPSNDAHEHAKMSQPRTQMHACMKRLNQDVGTQHSNLPSNCSETFTQAKHSQGWRLCGPQLSAAHQTYPHLCPER